MVPFSAFSASTSCKWGRQHSKTPSLQLKLLLLAHLIKGSSTQHLTGLGEPTQGQMGGK